MKNLDETPEIEVYCNRIHHEIKHGISHEKEDSTSIYIYIYSICFVGFLAYTSSGSEMSVWVKHIDRKQWMISYTTI